MSLSETTIVRIKIGTAIVVIMSLVAAVVGAIRWMDNVTSELRALNSSLDGIKRDGITMAQAAEAALRMAIENPGFRVPDPRDPSKVIEVRRGAGGSSSPPGLP